VHLPTDCFEGFESIASFCVARHRVFVDVALHWQRIKKLEGDQGTVWKLGIQAAYANENKRVAKHLVGGKGEEGEFVWALTLVCACVRVHACQMVFIQLTNANDSN